MEKLIALLLEYPERFERGEVPCCLWPFIDPDTSEPDTTPFPVVRPYEYSGPLRCSRSHPVGFHLRPGCNWVSSARNNDPHIDKLVSAR